MAFTFMFDRLYRRVEFGPDDLRLYQTPEITRLREVSLSAIPPWVLPCGVCASKFEHSVGVQHLAKKAVNQPIPQEVKKNIELAALVHDVGTPPFSHLSEHFLKLYHGKDHEQFAADVLGNSELGEEITRQGGDLETILLMVTGKSTPFGEIVNGSIDLDNLDNSLRYCLSMGLIDHPTYRPEILASCYRFNGNGSLYLDESAIAEIPGWEECRVRTYNFVYSESNLVPGAMLFRAIDLASRPGCGEIPFGFFRYTDSQAYAWLLERCNLKTRVLAEKVRSFVHYELAYSMQLTEVNPRFSNLIKDLSSRGQVADEIADMLGIPPESVAVSQGRNKGYKKIHLPVMDRAGTALPLHESLLNENWYFKVFVDPDYLDANTKDQLTKFTQELLCS